MNCANTDIIEIIGSDNFAKLVDSFGSTQVYIPKGHEHSTRFAEILGDDAANKLVSFCGGSTISLPINHQSRIKARNHAIYADRKAGADYSKLSIKYGLTGRQLRTIVTKSKIEEVTNERNKQTTQTQ